MDNAFEDIDAVGRRCMDHVLVNSDICNNLWRMIGIVHLKTLFSRDGNKWLDYYFMCGSLYIGRSSDLMGSD